MVCPSLSVVIPAFNEELYLASTLTSLADSAARCTWGVQLVVVDNGSADRTAEIARQSGATVVQEPVHNISRARNAGAMAASVTTKSAIPHQRLRGA